MRYRLVIDFNSDEEVTEEKVADRWYRGRHPLGGLLCDTEDLTLTELTTIADEDGGPNSGVEGG